MFKLMDFIIGKKATPPPTNTTNNSNNSNSSGNSNNNSFNKNQITTVSSQKAARKNSPTNTLNNSGDTQPTQVIQPAIISQPPTIKPSEYKPQFTRREREEIRQTLTKFEGSEAHKILLQKLAEHELQNIVENNNESDSSDDSDNYGTFCIKDVKEREPEEADNYGTMCVSNMGDSSPQNSSPDFTMMFREPEDWEKYILALEKGEWVDGMAEKGAFKRWKKDRPAMPSAYLKESPFQSPKTKPKKK